MKIQKLLGLLLVGAVGAALLGAGIVTTPNANAQSGAKVQSGAECPDPQQHSTQLGSETKKPVAATSKSYADKMWSFIKSTRYDQWSPAGDNGDFRESDMPHGALVKTYMNRSAAGNPDDLPHGSIIIKENFSPEKKLMAVTLMHRAKGYNPDANDWYWIKFNPDGTTAMMDTPKGKMAIAGKAKGCIECHSGADGDDYLFFND